MKQTILKIARVVGVIAATLCLTVMPAFAGPTSEVARNAGEYLLDVLFWICLAVTLFGAFKLISQKNYLLAGVSALGGGILCVIMKSPQLVVDWGGKILEILGLK